MHSPLHICPFVKVLLNGHTDAHAIACRHAWSDAVYGGVVEFAEGGVGDGSALNI